MSEQGQALTIERILVALDASPHSLAALEAAVDLAARFQAELSGLFVEDENLLRLAELPFVREIGIFTATRRRIDSEQMERQIRVQSRRVRRVFTMTTERAHVQRSFRVARGAVLSEVLSAAAEADVLVLGQAGWSLLQRGRLGSTVRGILPEQFGLALILKEGTCLGDPLAVVYDGSPVAERALIAAAALRRQPDKDRALIVLLLAEESQSAQTLQSQAASRLADRDAIAVYRSLTSANALWLADILQAEGCGMLVLPARSSALQDSVLVELLEHLDLPVLLVT
ncbi:MAG: universal stress protein [Anaerolineae bacterium]|jgi:nucleotide-binding universal stress UspA family protein